MISESQTCLEVANVTFHYQPEHEVFSGFGFTLPVGGVMVVGGPVGSGKTTLVRLIAGLLKPDSGEIKVSGKSTSSLNARERAWMLSGWGMILEDSTILNDRTVRDNIMTSVRLSSSRIRPSRNEIDSMLRQFGLVEKATRFPEALSKGEQKLVQLVMACARNPVFLLWDDPDSALDEEHLDIALELIHRKNLAGTTLLITSTHPEKYKEFGGSILNLAGVET